MFGFPLKSLYLYMCVRVRDDCFKLGEGIRRDEDISEQGPPILPTSGVLKGFPIPRGTILGIPITIGL